MTISASPRNVAKSARDPVRYGVTYSLFYHPSVLCDHGKAATHRMCRLFAVESSALKSTRTPKLPSFPRVFALVVVSVPRSALSMPSRLSTCPPTSRPRSPTDILPTASSSTDCLHRDPAKCWVLWVPTVLERVPR
ncbi:hypothetical protein F4818DRAFT_58083 [Hypoxylon cercidicola]|nr:hypothetical protein F4818DRAFT_58083 [Hypoxylon cercidicola]